MSNQLIKSSPVEQALIQGDLSGLNEEQRLQYYKSVCESIGLNPVTKPFEFMRLNNKLVLYATKAAAEQLRKIYSVSIRITAREAIGDVYVVTAEARLGEREDSSTGAVTIKGLQGDALANAYMKAETKAKRRVTLSVCGLAMLDESEVDTIAGAQKVTFENPASGLTQITPPQAPAQTPTLTVVEPPTEAQNLEAEFAEVIETAPKPEGFVEAPIHCGKKMFASKYAAKGFATPPWVCLECKHKEPRLV